MQAINNEIICDFILNMITLGIYEGKIRCTTGKILLYFQGEAKELEKFFTFLIDCLPKICKQYVIGGQIDKDTRIILLNVGIVPDWDKLRGYTVFLGGSMVPKIKYEDPDWKKICVIKLHPSKSYFNNAINCIDYFRQRYDIILGSLPFSIPSKILDDTEKSRIENFPYNEFIFDSRDNICTDIKEVYIAYRSWYKNKNKGTCDTYTPFITIMQKRYEIYNGNFVGLR